MKRRLVTLLAVFIAAGVGACSENLDSGGACPALCPSQAVLVRDTILNPVLVFDSTFVGYPERGQELAILLATRGDTLETRGVVRFDQLTIQYTPTNDTLQNIVTVDSSRIRLVLDRAGATIPTQVRFEIYDVGDTSVADTSATATLALFRANRLLGQKTFFRDSLTDTVYVPVSDSAILNKIKNNVPLRIGLRADGSGPVSLRVQTVETGNSALVYYRASKDSLLAPIVVSPLSNTPLGDNFPEIRSDLQDYMLVAKYAVPQTPGTMSVGGMPGRRAYLRFTIPKYLTDSTTIVKASLRLTQRPLAFGSNLDTITVHAHVGLAGPQVTDLRRATNIISAPGLQVLDSLLLTPRDSGVKTFEMFGLVRAWGTQSTLVNAPPRAVILRASFEGISPFEIRFFSTTAPAAVRPSMLISYVPTTRFGVP